MAGENPKMTGKTRGSGDDERLALAALNIAALDRDAGVFSFMDGETRPLTDIERVIPCFTPGTMIATPKGEVAVEMLRAGDRVLTRDNGIQTIRWADKRKLDYMQLKMLKELRPIEIKVGALGGGRPERTMCVSPMHRMLVVSDVAQMYFDETEVLVAAKDLLMLDGVEVSGSPYVTYVHFMCDHHEIVLADGQWSESFQPGDMSLKGLDAAQRDELFSLFPELSREENVQQYRAARRTLRREEVSVLFSA